MVSISMVTGRVVTCRPIDKRIRHDQEKEQVERGLDSRKEYTIINGVSSLSIIIIICKLVAVFVT